MGSLALAPQQEATVMPSARNQKKLCVLGDFSVGKTSLVRRYIFDEFSGRYVATAGVKIYRYQSKIEIEDEAVDVDQSIWDIEGSHSGEQLVRSYITGASGALIVGDLSRSNAIASMIGHAETFQDALPGRPVVFAPQQGRSGATKRAR